MFPVFVSAVEAEVLAVFVIVPVAPGLTWTVSVKAAVEPAAIVVIVQTSCDPVVQLNTGPELWTRETNVSPGGRTSTRVALLASLGPLFVRLIVYVASLPAVTVAGPFFVTARSAEVAMVVVALDESLVEFESAELELAVAVFVICVVFGVEGETATVIVHCALPRAPREAVPQVIVPPGRKPLGPVGGGVQLPAGPLF